MKKTDTGWVIDALAGSVVAQLRFDFAVGLLFRSETAGAELRVEGPFELHRGAERWALQPGGDASALAPVLMIQRDSVTEARVFDGGRMVLRFDSGLHIDVAPDDQHEAWELVGPGSLRVVSLPGGSLAIWDSSEGPGKPSVPSIPSKKKT